MDASYKKRKSYFVDPKFQAPFIIKFCIAVLFTSLVSAGVIFFFSRNSNTVAIENTEIVVKRTADFILPLLTVTVIVVSACAALLVMVMTLFITHKIVGPLVRIQKGINALKEGSFKTSFQIRKKDQLQELAKSLSEMTAAMRHGLRETKEKWSVLNSFLHEKKLPISDHEKAQLAKMQEEISQALDYFKV